jgi:quinol monooxygenase YgiN
LQHLVANWHVDRAKTDEWEAIWGQLQELAAQMDGFTVSRLLRSIEHPGKFTIYAQWRSRDDWEVYWSNPRVQELTRATFRLIKGPPIQEWFDFVSESGAMA